MGISFIGVIFGTILLTIDSLLYSLVALAYKIFMIVADLSVFGGNIPAANQIYDDFTNRIYMILSIVMVFYFSYQLILLIANPDGNTKGATSVLKDTVISLVAIAVCPMLFRYMAIFQHHILTDGTLVNIVTGNPSASTDNPGKNLAVIAFTQMYHPEGTELSYFIDGETFDMVEYEKSMGYCKGDNTSKARDTICDLYWRDLGGWYCNGNNTTICQAGIAGNEFKGNGKFTLATDPSLSIRIGKDGGMEYYWVISTAAAIAFVWFLLSYTIDMGTRAVKLAFLELIAPIPLTMRIFPKTKPTFDKWFKEITKTYLDVFIRVLVIAFIMELCQLVPTFVSALFQMG